MRRNLAVELAAPAAGNGGGTARAAAIGGDAVIANEIAVPGDECVAARRAARVFQIADAAGQIAGVDVPQTVGAADGGGCQQHVGGGVGRVHHLVVGMERGDVPRD